MNEKIALDKKLAELIEVAGGDTAATRIIKSVKGSAPAYTTLYRAKNGSYNDYTIRCMIEDLERGLKKKNKKKQK